MWTVGMAGGLGLWRMIESVVDGEKEFICVCAGSPAYLQTVIYLVYRVTNVLTLYHTSKLAPFFFFLSVLEARDAEVFHFISSSFFAYISCHSSLLLLCVFVTRTEYPDFLGPKLFLHESIPLTC